MRIRTTFCALAVGVAGAALMLAGCKGAEPISTGGITVAPTPSGVVSPANEAPQPAAPQQWVMPNLVGSNLQAAQDKIQAITGNPLFVTLSHDATGRSRQQVVDSNWKVCSQNIAPGATIGTDTTIDFGTVKQTEKCP